MSEAWYCATCKTALHRFGSSDSNVVTYGHGLQNIADPDIDTDHAPVPVPLEQLDNPLVRCDFCSSLDSVWTYTTADQVTETNVVTTRRYAAQDFRDRHFAARVRSVETGAGFTQIWGEHWAACKECAVFVEARDVLGLVARVTGSMPPRMVRGKKLVQVRGELTDIYTGLFASLQDGRTPIGADRNGREDN